MKQRRVGLLTLTMLLAGSLLGAGRAEARPRPQAIDGFYQGTLQGGDLDNWKIWLAVTGRSGYALLFGTGGPAPETQLLAAQGEGRLTKRGRSFGLSLRLIAVTTQDARVRIGQLEATGEADGRLAGRFSLAGRNGTFSATPAVRNGPGASELAGSYVAGDSDASVELKLDANGSLLVTGQAFERSIGRIEGVWSLDTEGFLWVLPTRMIEINELFDFVVKLHVPLKMRAVRNGNELRLYDPISDGHFATLARR